MAWTDVYTQFEKIVNRNFGKGSNWERKIEKEVDDLYRSHKGERDWDEAYRRWRQDQNAQDCGTLDAKKWVNNFCTKDADDAVKRYQKQLDELRIKLEEIQRKYKYRGYQSDWQYKNYAREYDKTSKLLEKAKAEEQGEEVISKAKLTSAIKRIAGLETLKTTTSAIRGYRPVSGGDFYLEGSTSDNWISIILYSKKAKSKRNEIINGLTKMGYEASNSSFNNDDIQVKTKKKKTKDSALDAKKWVVEYEDALGDYHKRTFTDKTAVEKFIRRGADVGRAYNLKVNGKAVKNIATWSADAIPVSKDASFRANNGNNEYKVIYTYEKDPKTRAIIVIAPGEYMARQKVMKAAEKNGIGKIIISKVMKMKDAATEVLQTKNGYTLGINNGKLVLAFKGETLENPHMWLGDAKNAKNMREAVMLFDKFANTKTKDADMQKEYTYSIRIGGDLKRVKVKADNSDQALEKVKKEAIKFKMERVKSKWDNNKLSTRDLR